MENKTKSIFETLNELDVSKHIEKKNGLTYLSWSWAWSSVKKIYPETSYKVYENNSGFNYHTDGMTAWVKVSVTIDSMEYIEYLPVMDFRNKSIGLSALTSMDVNKAIQRALTKAIARHGLGLYIYAGEDMPEASEVPKVEQKFVPINATQIKIIEDLIISKGADKVKFLEAFNVFAVNELDHENAGKAIVLLNKKKDAAKYPAE